MKHQRTTIKNQADFVEASEPPPPTFGGQAQSTHLYFYGEVTTQKCLATIQQLRELDKKLQMERFNHSLDGSFPAAPIWLHINTQGGEAFAAFALQDAIAKLQTPVYSVVEGLCASAGTFISMGCTKRYMQPSAFFLIHQVSNLLGGGYEQLLAEVNMMGRVMDKIANFYAKHSRVELEAIKAMLQKESWFDAQECLDFGFVDEIL